jgi:transcriptional regulator with XRE-family HTH domain
MSQDSLISQLAHRAKLFHQNTNISQAMMAKAIGMSEANYSQFLRKKRGLSAESTCLLLKFTNMPKQLAVAKLTQSFITSQIMLLQQNGGRISLDRNDGAWVPGLSGTDPNDSGSINDTPDADTSGPIWDQDLIDTLRETRGYHRQAVKQINAYIAKAQANAGIVTPSGVSQKFSKR